MPGLAGDGRKCSPHQPMLLGRTTLGRTTLGLGDALPGREVSACRRPAATARADISGNGASKAGLRGLFAGHARSHRASRELVRR
ncbi:MAG: hypothetical protein ACK557_06070, partial [Planctomycetota bacterium]